MTHTEVTFDTFPLAFIGRDQGGLFIDGDWIESKDLSDEGVKYLTTGNVGVGEFKEQGSGFISEETFVKLRCTEVLPGDILISRLNLPVGRACVVPDLGYRLVTSVDNVIVRPSASFDRRYLVFLLSTPHHLESTSNLARGTTMQRISRSALGRIRLAVPDLPTQRAIADFLDRETARIDLLIEKKQRLVALLGEKTRSVINRATTVGFRDCETRISGEKWLGEVASHWRITPIKWFARLQSGYAFKADRFGDFGTPLVRMNNLKRGVLDLSDAVSIADDDVNEAVSLRAGDILIGMSGSIGETGSLGNFAIVTERDLPCLLNQRVGRFQLSVKDLLPEYLTLVIQSAAFLDPIFLAATSTAQFNVSPSQISSVLFALPPIEEQREIVDEISKRLVGLNLVKERSLISIDRLREYRSALITAAVTGQMNVAKWDKAGANERRLDAFGDRASA